MDWETILRSLIVLDDNGCFALRSTASGGGSYTFPANHGNTAYVATGGNDGTGVVGNISKPFLTAQAALAAMDANNPGTIIILSSSGPQTIDDISYSDDDCPENLTIKDLCSCGIIFTGAILFYTLFLETQYAITINTATQWNVDDYYDIQCSAFIVPDTMAGVILALTGHIDCDNFLIAENANASIVLDVIVWKKSASIGLIDAFTYNDCTPWRWEAKLSQVGTSDPTIDKVLKNTLGTVATNYVNVGHYQLTSSGLFADGFTNIILGHLDYGYTGQLAMMMDGEKTDSSLDFFSLDSFLVNANALLNATDIAIEVYPAIY